MADSQVAQNSFADMAHASIFSQAAVNMTFSHVLTFAAVLFVMGLFSALFSAFIRTKYSNAVNAQSHVKKTQTTDASVNEAHVFSPDAALMKHAFSMQLTLLSVVLIFVASGRYWQTADGQIVVLCVFVVAVIHMFIAFVLSYTFAKVDFYDVTNAHDKTVTTKHDLSNQVSHKNDDKNNHKDDQTTEVDTTLKAGADA